MKTDGLPKRRMELFDDFPKAIRDFLNDCVADVNVDDVRSALKRFGVRETLIRLRKWEVNHIKRDLEAEKLARGL